jgi:hypothetical protein
MRVAGRPDVDTLCRVKQLLDRNNLPYALMGSLAVEVHGARPYTSTIEFLIGRAAFDCFCEHARQARFEQNPHRLRRFVDTRNGKGFEFFFTGHHPGRTGPAPIAFPDPLEASEVREEIRVMTLPWLIQVKLTANTYAELADVLSLIEVLGLDEAMVETLHSSVHGRFRQSLDERSRQEMWETRNDAALGWLAKQGEAE